MEIRKSGVDSAMMINSCTVLKVLPLRLPPSLQIIGQPSLKAFSLAIKTGVGVKLWDRFILFVRLIHGQVKAKAIAF